MKMVPIYSLVCFVVTNIILFSKGVDCVCSFPTSFRGRWRISDDTSFSIYSDSLDEATVRGNTVSAIGYDCDSFYDPLEIGQEGYILVNNIATPNDKICMKIQLAVPSTNIMTYTQQSVTDPVSAEATCATLTYPTPYNIYIKIDDSFVPTCPTLDGFQGVYYATYEEELGTSNCVNDNSSTLFITGRELRSRTCHPNTFRNTDFECIGLILDQTKFGALRTSNVAMILNYGTRYFCVRPFSTMNMLQMSFDTTDRPNGEVVCEIGQSMSSASTGIPSYISFTLTPADCTTGRCLNGADCTQNLGSFECSCVNGFSGTTCEINPDPCDPDPCLNNGVCNATSFYTYECLCPDGFAGQNCSTDLCVENPCVNGGTCLPLAGDSACVCTPDFTGSDCSIALFCPSGPCANGATCLESNNICVCPIGFDGPFCENDRCDPNPCLNEAVCEPRVVGFNCNCNLGFTGDICQTDLCGSDPCQNGGTCVGTQGGYQCDCPPGTVGSNCEIDLCNPTACSNGATCVPEPNGQFSCVCAEGYTGTLCDIRLYCSSDPCQNNATCIEPSGISSSSFICICQPGFTGASCETNIDECASNPCQNAGRCVDNINSYTCYCPNNLEFFGENCEERNPCFNNTCNGNGGCRRESDTVSTCVCNSGFSGPLCATEIPSCNPNPCQNGGTCQDGEPVTCACPSGFIGSTCEAVQFCGINNPCRNGATCVESESDCSCAPGFKGTFCNEEQFCGINNPCLNGATCVESDSECICAPGYKGTICNEVEFCGINNPCVNGATCVESTSSCNCAAGYTGTICNEALACQPNNPCLNGGSCEESTQSSGTAECDCVNGYTGNVCQIEPTTPSTTTPTIEEGCPSTCFNGGTCNLQTRTCDCLSDYTGDQCENKEGLNWVPVVATVASIGGLILTALFIWILVACLRSAGTAAGAAPLAAKTIPFQGALVNPTFTPTMQQSPVMIPISTLGSASDVYTLNQPMQTIYSTQA